ncbi:MAG TPA: HD domain-containing protein [Gemmatimonadales bacterium]|nr:HD domain-containing protein [Gemmatimonadales bacterium]
MPDTISPRLQEALDWAIELHGRDARKQSPVPVLAHLLAVCALVQLDGGAEEEAIAGLLHDALEDEPEIATAEEIERRFGSRVRQIVQISSDTPEEYRGGRKAPWKERKAKYLEHVRHSSPDLLRVTVADKVDNVRALLADLTRLGDALWTRFNAPKPEQLWYYRGALDAYKSAGFKGPLLAELERLVIELERTAA